MAIKLVVTNEEDHATAEAALQLFRDILSDNTVKSYLDDEYDEAYIDNGEVFLEDVVVAREASSLDTALLQEIGKAYRFEYDKAKAAGDEKLAERHLGAMLAIKRLMDMAQPPKY